MPPDHPAPAASARRPSAFSLIELLVCIAIIGILAALAISVVSQVRQSAVRAHCISNLRQCALGIQLYANDNKGYAPRITWSLEIRPYISGNITNNNASFPVSCPGLPYDNSLYGRTTYSLNSWLDTDHTNTNPAGGSPYWDMNLRRVESPSRKIMLFDGILASSNGTATADSHWAYNAVKGAQFIDFRHRGATANVLFVDSHVKSLRRDAVHEGMWDWQGAGDDPSL